MSVIRTFCYVKFGYIHILVLKLVQSTLKITLKTVIVKNLDNHSYQKFVLKRCETIPLIACSRLSEPPLTKWLETAKSRCFI